MAKASHRLPVVNKVLDCPTVPWSELKKFEANRLKDSEKRNVKKLKTAILDVGFSFPLVVWNPGNGVDPNYVIDGAGRMAALTALEKDGHQICDIPVVFVEAENREEAKKKVTMASSQFGIVTAETFSSFVAEIGGAEIMAPMISISSTAFASDYLGPAVGSEEEQPKKSRSQASYAPLPEFEIGDLFVIGNHELMVGHDDEKLLEKILKFIRKEFPNTEILKNGEVINSL